MRRREFIAGLGGTVAAPHTAVRAQSPPAEAGRSSRLRRIGLLMPYRVGDPIMSPRVLAFRSALQRLGYIDGATLSIDERWSTDDLQSIDNDAAELVNAGSEVIISASRRVIPALQQRAGAIPVVFLEVSDPVGQGVVKSLARPDGNMTGFAMIEFSIIGKMLELLADMVPGLQRCAMLFNPANPSTMAYRDVFSSAAAALNVRPELAEIRSIAEIEAAIARQGTVVSSGLLFPPDATVLNSTREVVHLALQARLPAIYFDRVMTTAGGLMSYSADQIEMWTRAGGYVDRILRGERPNDLPVQQPTRYQLVINLKTATALGIEVPPILLARADEVIE